MALDNEKDFSLNKSKDIENNSNFFDKIFDYFSRESVIIKAVFIVGIFSIVLGVAGMYFRIKNSFITSEIVLEDRASVVEALNRTKDTDEDGLSDYDELNMYNTSPYLEDTDLDGVSDYDEAILGEDGKCEGANCESVTALPTQEAGILKAIQDVSSQDMTFGQFKDYLSQMGYDKDSINSLTEEDYNQMKQTLPGASVDTETTNTNLTAEELKQVEQMKNLSVDQIKELMIKGGATEEQLSQFTDEDLKKLYLQTLDEISSSQQ